MAYPDLYRADNTTTPGPETACLTAANDLPITFLSTPKTHSSPPKVLQEDHQLKSSETVPELPIYARHPSKTVRFVLNALSTVIREKIPVADWNDNDYANLTALARSIIAREKDLSDFVYKPDSPFVKEHNLLASAIIAYIHMMDLKSDQEDENDDWCFDRNIFVGSLGLDREKHPLFDELEPGL